MTDTAKRPNITGDHRPSEWGLEKAHPSRMARAVRGGCGAVNAAKCHYPACGCHYAPKVARAAVEAWEAMPDRSDGTQSQEKP